MILSAKDTSIIAVICKFPEITDIELESYLNKLDNQELRNVCMVLLDRADITTLTEEEGRLVNNIANWHNEGVNLRFSENITRRQNNQEPNFTAKKLLKLKEQGKISDNVLVLYGISGSVPIRNPATRNLSREEKIRILRDRVQERFGVRWRECFKYPGWLDNEDSVPNWILEGF